MLKMESVNFGPEKVGKSDLKFPCSKEILPRSIPMPDYKALHEICQRYLQVNTGQDPASISRGIAARLKIALTV